MGARTDAFRQDRPRAAPRGEGEGGRRACQLAHPHAGSSRVSISSVREGVQCARRRCALCRLCRQLAAEQAAEIEALMAALALAPAEPAPEPE